MIHKNNMVYVFLFSLLCIFIKLPYLEFIENNYILYKIEILYMILNDNILLFLIWVIPYILLIIFITINLFEQLNTFDHRYKNRKTYLKTILWKDFIPYSIAMTLINYLTQLIVFVFYKDYSVTFVEAFIILFLYYIIVLVSSLLVICFYLAIHNIVFSFLMFLASITIFTSMLAYININIFELLYHPYFLCIILINIWMGITYICKTYIKKDFGGNIYEFRD